MLTPDPGYENWTASEGLDGNTDFHINDSPFMYTNGWDFVGVRANVFCLFLLDTFNNSCFAQSLYLPDGVSVGGTPFHGAPVGSGSGLGASGDDGDVNMFGEKI